MSDDKIEGEPTDVLAAEEFVVPAPDPALQPEKLQLPSDLVGDEPRDVLAAEEFAMPAPDEARVKRMPRVRRPPLTARLVAVITAPLLAGAGLWRWLRRRGSDA